MRRITTGTLLLLLFTVSSYARTDIKWYNNSQQLIDTIRKDNFGLKVIDEKRQPLATRFSNSYSTTPTLQFMLNTQKILDD